MAWYPGSEARVANFRHVPARVHACSLEASLGTFSGYQTLSESYLCPGRLGGSGKGLSHTLEWCLHAGRPSLEWRSWAPQ